MRRRIDVTGTRGLPAGRTVTTTLRNLTADILCERHNNRTNDLDTAGGAFAAALTSCEEINQARKWTAAPGGFQWTLRVSSVNGALLQRWFLKTAVNNFFAATGESLPIGEPEGRPGWPSRELVEMVYGLTPIPESMRLEALSAVGDKHNFGETFGLQRIDERGSHVIACVLTFRTFRFAVALRRAPVPNEAYAIVPGMIGATRMPFRSLRWESSNVEVRLV